MPLPLLFFEFLSSSLPLQRIAKRGNMKLSSTFLLWPTWNGYAFQHHHRPIISSRHHAISSAAPFVPPRKFSSLQMAPLLDQDKIITEVDGEVISIGGCFAVIRVKDDSDVPPIIKNQNTGGEETEEERVELEQALFSAQPDLVQNPNGGVCADGDLIGRTVTLSNQSKGLVVAHRHPIAFVLYDSLDGEGNTYDNAGMSMTCSISTEMVSINPDVKPGSIVNYMARHVEINQDGLVTRSSSEESSTSPTRPIFVPIPKISEIGLINTPLVTGITAIDALTPIGKGQNMLVIGTREKKSEEGTLAISNKREWMINLLKSVVEKNREKSMRCFYALTVADSTARSSFLNRLEMAGIQQDIVSIVSSQRNDATDPVAEEAAEAVAVAATACTLAEHHALTGGDALVIIDDINLHKSLWDITTRQLVEIYGMDSVVKADLTGAGSSEMRGYFSGLVQRAAKFNALKGGGSLTLLLLSTLPDDETDCSDDNDETYDASEFESMSEKIRTRVALLVKAGVPLNTANLRKIQIPLPRPSPSEDKRRLFLQHVEDLISMSDGQIWFDDDLAKNGRNPALDPSRSITRVGVGADTPCRADAPALRTISGSLRFQFQQATDMITSNGNSESNAPGDSKQALRRDAFLLAMHQTPEQTLALSQECVCLIAASRGHFDKIIQEGGKAGTAKGHAHVAGLLEFVEKKCIVTMAAIDKTLEMSLEDFASIENAIKDYF